MNYGRSNAQMNILDRPLPKVAWRSNDQGSVSLSAFAYLFSELVQYHQNKVTSISDLERRLEEAGYDVGLKAVELAAFRSKEYKRETRLMSILHFVSGTIWKSLFGRAADSLERSIDNDDEYMIVDYMPITSSYISVPSDLGQLSVDSYISGIISGVLQSAGFPARVTAHNVAMDENEMANPVASSNQLLVPRTEKAVFLCKFSREVLQRDAALER